MPYFVSDNRGDIDIGASNGNARAFSESFRYHFISPKSPNFKFEFDVRSAWSSNEYFISSQYILCTQIWDTVTYHAIG